MKLVPVLTGVFAFLNVVGPAFAENTKAQLLADLCTEKGAVDIFTMSYVDGVLDTTERSNQMATDSRRPLMFDVCVPDKARVAGLSMAVCGWLHRHPEELTKRANDVVVEALNSLYPCIKR